MAYCVKCSAKVDDNVSYCQQCGAKIPDQGQKNYSENTYNKGQAEYFDRDEVLKNRLMGVLSYLGVFVLIPVLAGDKSSEYVRFHSNQGLVLFIVSLIIQLLSGDRVFGFHSFINFGGTWLSWIFNLLEVAALVFAVVGIVYACRGDRRELPFVGRIQILK